MSEKRTLIILLLIVSVTSVVFADQIVKTADGREVLLKDNGTWEYVHPQKNKGPQQAAIGNTGAVLKILSYRDNVKSSNPFIKPSEGMKYFAVETVIDNSRGRIDIDFNMFMGGEFELKDKDAYKYDITMFSHSIVEPSLSISDDVEKGDITRGWVGFEVKKDVSVDSLRIRYVDTEKKIKTDWIHFK